MGGELDHDTARTIEQAKGKGAGLHPKIRRSMESSFGADFSGVRVHNDAGSHDLNQRIQAKAFTTGNDIFFGQGAYQPATSAGQQIMAHELTHVVQQGAAPTTQRTLDTDANVVQRLGGGSLAALDEAANQKRLAHAKEDYLFDKSLGKTVTDDDEINNANELDATNARLAAQGEEVRSQNDVPWPPPNAFFFWQYKEDPDFAVKSYIKRMGLEGTPNQIATIHARAKNKSKIPKPDVLMPPAKIAAHLGKFANGAHTFIDPITSKRIEGELADPRFKGWGRDANFVAPLDEANALNAKAHQEDGIETIEDELGIGQKNWSNSEGNPDKYLVRWIIPKPKLKLDESDEGILLEMATGRETGAFDDFWVAGGLTKGGASEVALKAIPREQLVKLLAKGTIRQKKEYFPETRDNIPWG